MGIKVHGRAPSTATMRVLAAAYEKELDFEFVVVDIPSGANKREPFISLNPFGKVPVLEDGDTKLFESRAITRYIAYGYETKGTQLSSKDPKQLATQAVWEEVEAHHFEPVASNLVWELFYKKMLFRMQPDMVIVQENEAKLAKILDIYEARLVQCQYLAGETFTLADLHHLPCLHYLMATRVEKVFDERSHVRAWCKDILARPAWQKVVAMQKQL